MGSWNLGDIIVGMEHEVATVEHTLGEMSHDRFSLKMQVPEHFVRAPTAQEADHVGINLRAEQGHCPG